MPDLPEERKWNVRMVRAGLPGLERLPDRLGLPGMGFLSWLMQPIRPADIVEGLHKAMLNKANMLEDVNYQKVIPNRFVIQVAQENFARQYKPIEDNILRQWKDRLLEDILTANHRQGRKEYRLGGPLQLEIKPAGDLKQSEARILFRIEPAAMGGTRNVPEGWPPAARPPISPARNSPGKAPLVEEESPKITLVAGRPNDRMLTTAYLEMIPSGQYWTLYTGINTIGRSELCQIYLNNPVVQEKRLVSGLHAYIVIQNGMCILFDGAPDGRSSANGTYVNYQKVSPSGHRLQAGDTILLAAIDPQHPRSDTPGVVLFHFWFERKG